MTPSAAEPRRLASLDQFRGYTVLAMVLVNFVGRFDATPAILLHHHTYCSFADTVMAQFFFAVGFAFRLTFRRRLEREGRAGAYGRVVKRLLGLVLVALVVHAGPEVARTWSELVENGPSGAIAASVRSWFQTLMHIAVTSLWILPVVGASAKARLAFVIFSAVLQVAASQAGYFAWVQDHGIDGGVLGFLAWTIPMIAGTLACDAVADGPTPRQIRRLLAAGAGAMLVGWLLSCGTTLYGIPRGVADPAPDQSWAADPVIPAAERLRTHRLGLAELPFVAPPGPEAREQNYWMMSQRSGSVSYHIFAAGLSVALFALFVAVCDRGGVTWGPLRTFGVNALVAYILHDLVRDAVHPFMPPDSPLWYVAAGLLVNFVVLYLFLRSLEKQNVVIKL
jgi:predicted acyltransferase